MDRGTDSVVPKFVDVFGRLVTVTAATESSARRSFGGRFMDIFYKSGRFFPMIRFGGEELERAVLGILLRTVLSTGCYFFNKR